VSVAIDSGQPQPLDGRALQVDPGEHRTIFERAGFEPLERRFSFSEGSQLREEQVVLSPTIAASAPVSSTPPARPAPETDSASTPGSNRTVSLLPIIASSAVSLAGGVGFTYFGLRARAGDSELESCSPDCARARVDEIKRDYLLANVSLGVGIAGAVTTGVLVILNNVGASRANGTARSTLLLGPRTVFTTHF
jgi:hypothetical protein